MSVFIPAKVRGTLYSIYAVIGLGLGATQVGYSAAQAGQPVWLTVALAVFAFVGTGIGYTAASNTPATAEVSVKVSPAQPEPYAGDSKLDAALHDGTE